MSMKDTYNHTGVRLGAYKAFAAADSTTAFTGSAITTSCKPIRSEGMCWVCR